MLLLQVEESACPGDVRVAERGPHGSSDWDHTNLATDTKHLLLQSSLLDANKENLSTHQQLHGATCMATANHDTRSTTSSPSQEPSHNVKRQHKRHTGQDQVIDLQPTPETSSNSSDASSAAVPPDSVQLPQASSV